MPLRRIAGSSPLARGLPSSTRRSGPSARDHPRSRGVYPTHMAPRCFETGSSPLARGLPPSLGERVDSWRIIPARAGFTTVTRSRSPWPADHPRSRGVYVLSVQHSVRVHGSSPLARGLPGLEVRMNARTWIIPARAGFTRISPISTPARRDHPRSRGVYAGVRVIAVMACGSSPLARGLRVLDAIADGGWRIIPARAGFTPPGEGAVSRRSDHPRSRGVYEKRRGERP